jgi:hypothetical protein
MVSLLSMPPMAAFRSLTLFTHSGLGSGFWVPEAVTGEGFHFILISGIGYSGAAKCFKSEQDHC